MLSDCSPFIRTDVYVSAVHVTGTVWGIFGCPRGTSDAANPNCLLQILASVGEGGKRDSPVEVMWVQSGSSLSLSYSLFLQAPATTLPKMTNYSQGLLSQLFRFLALSFYLDPDLL